MNTSHIPLNQRYLRLQRWGLLSLLLLLSVCFGTALSAQEVVRVTGKVVSKEEGKPLMGVNVIDTQSERQLATTDEDGRFAINVHSDATLLFSMVGAESVRTKLKNRTFLEIKMPKFDIELGEATVTVKRIKDEVRPEATDIQVIGNYLHIKTRVRVPREMFAGNTRLVVQPILNNVTKNKLQLMRPMVYDAKKYHRTQERMYSMDLQSGDPLAAYITIKNDTLREKGRTNDIIGYQDSIYVDNVKDEYSCDVYMAMENYNRILYRDTTIIARGTVNPLRFLDYSFSSQQILDTAYYPKPELQLRDSKGEINLHFPIGKATLDLNDAHNAAEMHKLNEQLLAITQNKDFSLRAFSILGTASPDGTYNSNLNLAGRRMKTALDYILSQLDSETRQKMKVSSQAEVAPWSAVVEALRKDSLFEEANILSRIIEKNASRDRQSVLIRNLPFYKELLLGKYLPRLRRVDYQMNYSIFRTLTFDEIKELYAKDYRQLSRYEYFRLFRNEPNAETREKYIRQALEIYPSFMIAANDLQEILIGRGTPDPELLKPFAGEKAPIALNMNHIIACINCGRFGAADSIADILPNMEETYMLKSVVGALNGRFAENYEAIASTGVRNNILMLLAMKRDEEALKLSEQLPSEEALTHYIKAICYNRTGKPVEAFSSLEKALKMDPALRKTAMVDGDVNDLILDKQK